MARTKSFKKLVQRHVRSDAKFAEALLREGVDAMLAGDVETGKTILRDYIKATVGFEKLGAATGAPAKSLIRMFGPEPDFGALARSMGCYGEGPIEHSKDIRPALERALAQVKKGRLALVDTITQHR